MHMNLLCKRRLLHGDDDTVFFPDALMTMLAPFDPDLPYFITDSYFNVSPALAVNCG